MWGPADSPFAQPNDGKRTTRHMENGHNTLGSIIDDLQAINGGLQAINGGLQSIKALCKR